MEKRLFVLCDKDHTYVNRFMDYTGRQANFPFRVHGFTGEEGLASFLVGGGAAVGLVAWSLWQEWKEDFRQRVQEEIPCLLLLTEDRRSGQVGIPAVYKYQAMETLTREILDHYEKLARDREEKQVTRLIGFYSTIGSCGKTTAALHLGQAMAEKEGREVLYMNLEPFAGWAAERRGGNHSLSDVLYERKMEGCLRVQSLSASLGKIAVIAPVVNPEDLWSLSTEEVLEMVREMKDGSVCDTILLDLGQAMDPIPILQCCDQIVLVRRDGAYMDRKMEEMKSYLGRRMGGLAAEKKSIARGGKDALWMELCIPEMPVLSGRMPGDGGENCQELLQWIWTQWRAGNGAEN